MKMRIEVVSVSADGNEQRRQMLTIERQELAMETLGMSLWESKALLEGVQDFMIAQQVGEDLERRRACPHLRPAGHSQRLRNGAREDALRPGERAKSAMASVRLPD
jgi:hypothetical protein